MHRHCLIAILVSLLLGCETAPVNPSFPVTTTAAAKALDASRDHPAHLCRPLVIVGGYNDPGIGPAMMASRIRPCFEDDRILEVTVAFSSDFDGCRRQLTDAIDRRFPSSDPTRTTEVDVIGLSMGGLVARYAATPREGMRQLNATRLFTVSSPFNGAALAALPTFDAKQIAMREGSPFLGGLAESDARATYELIPYVRLNDEIVGEANAAPPGRIPWWVATPAMESSHFGAALDVRIVADIVKRLRDERPFTNPPPAPFPDENRRS